MYKVINDELMIKTCNIGDLTFEQVRDFPGGWKDKSSISALTLFADFDGFVVINKDNEHCKFYTKLAENYISKTEDERKDFAERMSPGYAEEFSVMDRALQSRKLKKDTEILSHQTLPHDDLDMIEEIERRYSLGTIGCLQILQYGIMQGKRMERARRKKAVV